MALLRIRQIMLHYISNSSYGLKFFFPNNSISQIKYWQQIKPSRVFNLSLAFPFSYDIIYITKHFGFRAEEGVEIFCVVHCVVIRRDLVVNKEVENFPVVISFAVVSGFLLLVLVWLCF